jgi:hypothetical protein
MIGGRLLHPGAIATTPSCAVALRLIDAGRAVAADARTADHHELATRLRAIASAARTFTHDQ